MTPKGDLVTASPLLYLTHPECLVIAFDLREPDGPAELRRLRAALRNHADVETLDEDHLVLVVRPGWVLERTQ